jgi:hypothetical protein
MTQLSDRRNNTQTDRPEKGQTLFRGHDRVLAYVRKGWKDEWVDCKNPFAI